jgi:hypothetical protein
MFPPEDEPPSAYDQNRKEQYAALGRFVEAFEALVNEAREGCLEIMLGGGLAKIHHAEIVFHHQAMTAKPLFEILRAMIAEIIKDPNAPEYAEREAFGQVLKQINKEYMNLANKRNNLLHGTWFIGYSSPDDPDSKTFQIRKFRSGHYGLKQLELPAEAAELDALTIRCIAARDWLSLLCACLGGTKATFSVRERFYQADGKPRILNAAPSSPVGTKS